jgi:hypothetical protein
MIIVELTAIDGRRDWLSIEDYAALKEQAVWWTRARFVVVALSNN